MIKDVNKRVDSVDKKVDKVDKKLIPYARKMKLPTRKFSPALNSPNRELDSRMKVMEQEIVSLTPKGFPVRNCPALARFIIAEHPSAPVPLTDPKIGPNHQILAKNKPL